MISDHEGVCDLMIDPRHVRYKFTGNIESRGRFMRKVTLKHNKSETPLVQSFFREHPELMTWSQDAWDLSVLDIDTYRQDFAKNDGYCTIDISDDDLKFCYDFNVMHNFIPYTKITAEEARDMCPKQTSCGFGFPYKTKEDFLYSEEGWNYTLEYDRRLGTDDPIWPIWSISLKDELREVNKVLNRETRTFLIPEPAHYITAAQYMRPAFHHMLNHPMATYSTVGINPYSPQWNELFDKVHEFELRTGKKCGFDFDVSRRDSRVYQWAFHLMFLVLVSKYKDPTEEDIRRIKQIIKSTMQKICTAPDGSNWFIDHGNASGWFGTCDLNGFVTFCELLLAWIHTVPTHLATREAFLENVVVQIFSDDGLCSVHPDVQQYYNPTTISTYLKTIGVTYKFNSEKDFDFHHTDDLVFLSMSFKHVTWFGKNAVVPCPQRDKIMVTLCRYLATNDLYDLITIVNNARILVFARDDLLQALTKLLEHLKQLHGTIASPDHQRFIIAMNSFKTDDEIKEMYLGVRQECVGSVSDFSRSTPEAVDTCDAALKEHWTCHHPTADVYATFKQEPLFSQKQQTIYNLSSTYSKMPGQGRKQQKNNNSNKKINQKLSKLTQAEKQMQATLKKALRPTNTNMVRAVKGGTPMMLKANKKTETNYYLQSLLAPEDSRGARIPDYYTFPTSTLHLETDLSVASGANGGVAMMICPTRLNNPATSYLLDGTGFYSLSPVTYTANGYTQISNLYSQYRVVSSCVVIRYTGAPMNAQGELFAGLSTGGVTLTGQTWSGLSSTCVDSEVNPVLSGARVLYFPIDYSDRNFRPINDATDVTPMIIWGAVGLVTPVTNFEVKLYQNLELLPAVGYENIIPMGKSPSAQPLVDHAASAISSGKIKNVGSLDFFKKPAFVKKVSQIGASALSAIGGPWAQLAAALGSAALEM